MMREKYIKYLILLSLGLCSFPVLASDNACDSKLKLQDYGPNSLSVRKDQNDSANLDFTLSQMFPFFHNGCPGEKSSKPDWYFHPYFAFTGEFGFYAFGNRDSAPVIGKRFNPKVFVRHWLDDGDSYYDIGYAHESNGQSINNEAAYLQKVAEVQASGDRVEYASDYLSRGWDYLDYNYKRKLFEGRLLGKNYVYVNLKYFLPNGLFQGAPEEFYPWETTEGKSRNEVDGVTVMVKTSNISDTHPNGLKFVVQYTTGYKRIFTYNTVRLEATYKREDAPGIIVWVAKGYNTDLIDYYKNLVSFGIGMEFRNFVNDY